MLSVYFTQATMTIDELRKAAKYQDHEIEINECNHEIVGRTVPDQANSNVF